MRIARNASQGRGWQKRVIIAGTKYARHNRPPDARAIPRRRRRRQCRNSPVRGELRSETAGTHVVNDLRHIEPTKRSFKASDRTAIGWRRGSALLSQSGYSRLKLGADGDCEQQRANAATELEQGLQPSRLH